MSDIEYNLSEDEEYVEGASTVIGNKRKRVKPVEIRVIEELEGKVVGSDRLLYGLKIKEDIKRTNFIASPYGGTSLIERDGSLSYGAIIVNKRRFQVPRGFSDSLSGSYLDSMIWLYQKREFFNKPIKNIINNKIQKILLDLYDNNENHIIDSINENKEEEEEEEEDYEIKIKIKNLNEKIKNEIESIRIEEIENKGKLSIKKWNELCNNKIPKKSKLMIIERNLKIQNSKKIILSIKNHVKKTWLLPFRVAKEQPSRARRLAREVSLYWRNLDRVKKDSDRIQEKIIWEERKNEEEILEAKRQQAKLNFLLTQTELYSHFIANKMGVKINNNNNNEKRNNEKDSIRNEALIAAEEAVQAQLRKAQEFDQYQRDIQVAASPTKIKINQKDEKIHDIKTIIDIKQPKSLTGTLKNYQMKGLHWLVNLYHQGINGILADEMGLGKTIQAISLLTYIAETIGVWGPVLIVAPLTTLHNWNNEFIKFAPNFKILPYWGVASERKLLRKHWNQKILSRENSPFHIIITSYQMILQDEKYFRRIRWHYLILDEAQAIKSTNTLRWKSLVSFDSRNRLLLTGTPIQNSLTELWALLHFIMPTLFDSSEEFKEWFTKDIEGAAQSESTGFVLNEHQLKRLQLILKPFMLRRLKKDVEREMTGKIEKTISNSLRKRQRILYRGLKDKLSTTELFEKISTYKENELESLLNLVMQFRKVCNHPDLFEKRDIESPYQFHKEMILPLLTLGDKKLYIISYDINPINYFIPKLIYNDMIKPLNSYSYSIYEPLRIVSSKTFSFLFNKKFNDYFINLNEYIWYINSKFIQRWIFLCYLIDNNNSNSYKKLFKYICSSITSTKSSLKLFSNDIINLKKKFILKDNDDLLSFNNIFIPTISAPFIDLLCSNYNFMMKKNFLLNDDFNKKILIGKFLCVF